MSHEDIHSAAKEISLAEPATSLPAQFDVNIIHVGCMHKETSDSRNQEACHAREQDLSSVNAIIQKVVQNGSCGQQCISSSSVHNEDIYALRKQKWPSSLR
jgi:hypothetical protein